MWRTVAARKIWQPKNAFLKSARGALRLVVSHPATGIAQTLRNAHHYHATQRNSRLAVWSFNFVRAFSSLPPHTKVTLPALSPTMEQGTIVSWSKKEGDKLKEGELIADIETDKATMGFETPREGYMAKILVPAGTKDVPIGKLVCIIVGNEADIAAFKDFKDDSPAAPKAAPKAAAEPAPPPSAAPPPAAAAAPSAAPAAAPSAAPSGGGGQKMTAVEQRGARVYASPMAKKLAEAQQLRLDGAGSGVFGSIKSTDLAGMPAGGAPKAGAPAAGKGPAVAPQGGYIDIPVSNVRAVIAKRLLESKQNIPHYYVTMDCEVDKIMKLRSHINKKHEKQGVKVSLNDFIIKATATACRKVPEANSYWMDKVIRQFDNVDVSIAVSTDGGLITPIVFSADRKGVIQISSEVKALAKKARENKLKPNEFQGGTVCVSNLGMFGVTQFCAVINPPQSCILAVGNTWKKLLPDSDPKNTKGFKEVNMMTATLSADHRTVDGAVAAKWLQHFQEFMADPQMMIM